MVQHVTTFLQITICMSWMSVACMFFRSKYGKSVCIYNWSVQYMQFGYNVDHVINRPHLIPLLLSLPKFQEGRQVCPSATPPSASCISHIQSCALCCWPRIPAISLPHWLCATYTNHSTLWLRLQRIGTTTSWFQVEPHSLHCFRYDSVYFHF